MASDWGAKDASNTFITAFAGYTASTATTLSGDADVVTDVNFGVWRQRRLDSL